MSARPTNRPPLSAATFTRRTVILRLLLVATAFGLVAAFVPFRTDWPLWCAAGGWGGFSLYWSAEARWSAETERAESAASRRVHLGLTNIGQLLLFVPVVGLDRTVVPPSPGWAWAGLAIEAASLGLAVWARRNLGGNWSGRIEIKKNHELVRTGPYQRLRHPIYTALIGMCVGTALVDGQLHAVVGVALVVLAYWRKIGMEEANMRAAFGAHYDEYRRQTWGAIPGLF
jgi:protein-S-isoprenylcysteine O-methyltransferase Ste14